MPNNPKRVEIITGHERRRRYAANERLSVVNATMHTEMTVSAVAVAKNSTYVKVRDRARFEFSLV